MYSKCHHWVQPSIVTAASGLNPLHIYKYSLTATSWFNPLFSLLNCASTSILTAVSGFNPPLALMTAIAQPSILIASSWFNPLLVQPPILNHCYLLFKPLPYSHCCLWVQPSILTHYYLLVQDFHEPFLSEFFIYCFKDSFVQSENLKTLN
jgi:hypothetical protein